MLRNNNVSEIKISKLCFCGNVEVSFSLKKSRAKTIVYIFILKLHYFSPDINRGGIIEIYEHYTFT